MIEFVVDRPVYTVHYVQKYVDVFDFDSYRLL